MLRSGLLPALPFLVGVPFCSEAALAQTDTARGSEPSPWTPDDILHAETAGQFAVSPDGRWVLWVKATVEPDRGRVTNVHLSSLTEEREVQLTRGTHTHSAPRWSPDGRRISFLSNRPLPKAKDDAARTQLWLMDPGGGEPWPVTEFERGIRGYAWRDSTTILFTAQEDPARAERERKRGKDDAVVVDDSLHEPPVRLFALTVGDRRVTRLSVNDDWITALDVSPDGGHAVTVHRRQLSYAFDQRKHPATWLWDLARGGSRQLFADYRIIPNAVWWGADSKGFYVSTDSTRHPRWRVATIDVLAYYDLEQGRAMPVNLDWPRGLGSGLAPTPDGVIALLADGVHLKPARYTKSGSGWTRAWIEGKHVPNIYSLVLSRDARAAVYQTSTASLPTQWYRARLDGARLTDETQLTRLNPGYQKRALPRSEIVRWRGARNDEVEGILHYPIGYEAGRRYPLILSVHGGPSSADMDSWSQSWGDPKVLLNQKGAFILEANYHGSSNYGLDWVESIGNGRYYDLEIPDLQRGMEYVIRRGLADANRLATMGWSNGSILSIELTTRDQRLKAASVGAGDVEWISDWGNVDFGMSFDNYYFGKAPYEDPQLYIRKSPFFRLDRVRTPTLIFFGTEDRNVPPSQGWSHYRVLQQLGHAEVRFVLFPGAAHGLSQIGHQRRKLEEELAWFDRHLFNPQLADSAIRAALVAEAFDSTSPLGQAFRRTRFARVAGRFGVLRAGTLAPETVTHQGIDLGRFEVTRAQWAAFDSSYRVPAGTDDHPMYGVTFEQAQAYVRWLAQVTGEPYRLGAERELRKIYEAARGAENTLDHWAGYPLNPDDAARVATKAVELPGDAPLLKPVGSFRGHGEGEPVFDLGGNVAEWAEGENGKGVVLGGSADRAADAKGRSPDAAPAYRGLRVVRGAPRR